MKSIVVLFHLAAAASPWGCGGSVESSSPDASEGPRDVADAGVRDLEALDAEMSDGASPDLGDELDASTDDVVSGSDGAVDLGVDGGPSAGDAGDGRHPDIVRIIEVRGRRPGRGWSDSYSVGDRCYCDSTFDHGIGPIEVDTAVGRITVREACDRIGPGPGKQGRPIYNDIQCGNGPPNNAGDEDDCPGRVDIGPEGCGHIGPTWNFR